MSRPLRPVRSAHVAWLLLALTMAAPAAAQTVEQAPPAHVSVVEGAVILERDGKTDANPGSMPLLAGDRLRTQNGRAEILFADGSTLHLDANTTVDFQSDEVLRLLDGRVRANITGPSSRLVAYRVDAPSAWVQITQPGEYRVALLGGERAQEVELAVLRGAAELVNEDGATRVRAGERAFATAGLAPSQPYVFNSAAWDAFDQWSEARRSQRLGVSAEYVPDEVQPYATVFNDYGSWRHEQTYGYVWYPRVAVGWRPYFHGRWSHLRPFGWTWVGYDPWAWPTHHFGRWGFSAGSWFWIPGKHWGPAWVSWAYYPGYVSWCPLGFNNFAVFNFNVHRGHGFNPWHGWTVVPHRRFGHGFVNVNVVNANHLDSRARSGFVIRDSSPAFSGVAVSRSQTPIRLAGARSVSGYAVPRNGGAVPGSTDGDSFRSRGGSVAPSLSGPGFPAPAREPRATAIPRAGDRSVTTSESANAPARDPRGSAISRSGARSSGTPAAAGAPVRTAPTERAAPQGERMRAVPRAGSGQAPSPSSGQAPSPSSGQASQPGSAQAPQSNPGQPSRQSPGRAVGRPSGRGGDDAPAYVPSPERARAVPRQSSGYTSPVTPGRVSEVERTPTPQIQRHEGMPRRSDAPVYQPDRGMQRAPESPQYGSPRAMPRSSGPESQGAPSSGPSRGMARPSGGDRPSSPPPSAGSPSRSGGDGSAGSRSSAGAPASRSSGRAVSRSGGGRGGD